MSALDVKRAKFFIVEVGVDQREKAQKEDIASQTRKHWSVIERVQARLTDCVAEVSEAIGGITNVLYRQNDLRSLAPPPGTRHGDEVQDEEASWLETKVRALENHVAALKAQRSLSNRSSPKRVKPLYSATNPRLTPLPGITSQNAASPDDSLKWGADTPIDCS
jgi:hypothetical protein